MIRSGPVRYARAARFAPPDRDAPGVGSTTDGTICPQPPSRLERVMGAPRDRHPQGEDCVALSVVVPSSPGPHPVLVFLHGGAFSSGAGLLDWYDGASLAAEQDLVVVGVNYRLGPFGWLLLDDVSPGNLGLLDQIAALEWVRDEIGGYGGDPEEVTVAGQSAGGASIAALLEVPGVPFRRAVIQSGPGLGAFTGSRPDEAAARGRRVAELGADPTTADPADLLRAVGGLAQEVAARSGGSPEPPLLPVLGVDPLPAGRTPAVGPRQVVVGSNRDEMTAFGVPLSGAEATSAELFAAWADGIPAVGLTRYRFDWRPEGSPFGATHCLELPLLLGDEAAWRGSPMLGTTPWSTVDRMGRQLRAAWAGFARTGRIDRDLTADVPITWST